VMGEGCLRVVQRAREMPGQSESERQESCEDQGEGAPGRGNGGAKAQRWDGGSEHWRETHAVDVH
jgi:hypothetical protein